MRAWGLAEVLSLRIKNIYMGQWTGMTKAFTWAFPIKWCCVDAGCIQHSVMCVLKTFPFWRDLLGMQFPKRCFLKSLKSQVTKGKEKLLLGACLPIVFIYILLIPYKTGICLPIKQVSASCFFIFFWMRKLRFRDFASLRSMDYNFHPGLCYQST